MDINNSNGECNSVQCRVGESSLSECRLNENIDLSQTTESRYIAPCSVAVPTQQTATPQNISSGTVNLMTGDIKDPLQVFKKHFGKICNLKKCDFKQTSKKAHHNLKT